MERTIGQLAKAAGINVETIRYYERRGLTPQPEKPAEGFRSYPEDTLNKIRFIKRAQKLGFSLDEVKTLLNIDEGQCHDVQEIAAQKLAMIRQKMANLERLANNLDDWMQHCQSTPDNQPCPLIHALIKNDNSALLRTKVQSLHSLYSKRCGIASMSKETPKLSLIGGVIATIGASVCCVGPLVLLMLGIGGSWVSGLTAFEPYRPIFITIMAILLARAGWQLYRPIEQCPKGSVCTIPSARLRYRQIFWSALLIAIVLVTSPYWIPIFI